mmetsp:Transcript_18469/g.31065  ORF Transcript_18469/g.31065 Transcript_18469/m.31065 type:complete len:183 (+) Transcript_18469:32-580(+)
MSNGETSIHHSGYLQKKTSNGKWQRRFFEINGSYLTYYKNQNMTKLLAAMSIPEVGAIKMVDNAYNENDGEDIESQFMIELQDRQYFLRAPSSTDAKEWVKALKQVKELKKHNKNGNVHSRSVSNPLNLSMEDDSPSSFSDQSMESLNSTPQRNVHNQPTSRVQKAPRNSCFNCLIRCWTGC